MTLKHRQEAWNALFKRYAQVWRHFWLHRHELTLPQYTPDEAEFLPAALSIQAQPVSPTGRWVARLLVALLLTLLAWSVFGRMDIIVNAQGKVIASGYTKTLSSVEIASVRSLAVQEGQAVKAGDVLIELDTRASDSDRKKFEADRQIAWLQAERSKALLQALQTQHPPFFPLDSGVDKTRYQDALTHLQDQWRDFTAKRQRLQDEIERYSTALPLATQRAHDYAELAATRDVAQHAWMEKEQARIDLQGQLSDARNQLQMLITETRKNAQDALNDANRLFASSEQEVNKATAHGELLTLTAPVDGTVQQLTVHNVGAAVPAAQPLMQIVPQQKTVEVEAFLENKDVGFVVEGQDAQVKIDTFEYTKYGTLSAVVSHVSRDAIQDEKKGLIYAVKVVLKQSSLMVEGREMLLSPGMTASVEIKTGERRIIDYVLSPLLQHGHESLHER